MNESRLGPILGSSRASALTAALDDGRAAQVLLQHSPDVVALVDAQARLLYANPAAEPLLGWSIEQRLGESLLDLVHPDDQDRVIEALLYALSGPGPHPETIYRMRHASGRWVTIASTSTNLLDDPLIGAIVVSAREAVDQIASLDSLVATLVRASEFRDPYTAGHQRSVAAMTHSVCVRLGLPYQEVDRITLGAALHDIGKIAVPTEILTKPGKLSPAEWLLVKEHPVLGHEIVSSSDLSAPIADIVLHHHERLDGSGYPHGLSGDEIRIGSRIVAVADTVDAICAHRPYRPALGWEFAKDVIRDGRGSLFDAEVVDASLSCLSPAAPLPGRSLRVPVG